MKMKSFGHSRRLFQNVENDCLDLLCKVLYQTSFIYLFIFFFLYYHLIKIEYIGQFNILIAKTLILQISFLVSFLCIAWICDQYKLKLEAERKNFPSSKHHQIIIPTHNSPCHPPLILTHTHTHTHTSIFHTLSHTYTPINYLTLCLYLRILTHKPPPILKPLILKTKAVSQTLQSPLTSFLIFSFVSLDRLLTSLS